MLVCVSSAVGKNREILIENFENTTFLEQKDPLHPLPSVHVAEERVLSSPVPRPQLMSDARFFGPLEGALVTSLIFLVSITQLLDVR